MRKNLIFSEEEFQRRIRKTKEMMDKGGMEMLLVMDPANMNYLTGYFPDYAVCGTNLHRSSDI